LFGLIIAIFKPMKLKKLALRTRIFIAMILLAYITDDKSKPIAILNIPYLEKDDFLTKELQEFLQRIAFAFILVLLTAIAIAFWLSTYITKSLKTISDKINTTRLEKRNEKINIHDTSEEISTLVNSYNSMIDELEESAVQLAKSEREHACATK